MATDVIIDPSTGQIYWNDSAGVGTESISIKGDAVNTISFTGYSGSFSPGSTPAGALTLVTIKDSAGTDALIPGTTGYNLGSSTLRWNTFATNANLSGTLVVSDSTNASSLITGSVKINGGIAISGNAFIGGTINVASPITIPNGGTNASSFGQSAGFVYYDGTSARLLAASGATINYTNGYYQFDNRVYATSFFANNAQMPNGSGIAGRVTIWSGNNTIGSDADFTYDSTTNTLAVFGNINAIGVTASGIAITSGTASTSTTTGALVVAGGVGISGRLTFNQASFGTTGIATLPTMAMIGQTGDPIFMSILEDNSVSFEGSQGQLFSISPNLSTGYIWSVNDISGVPLLRASVGATIGIAEFGGVVGIGQTNPIYKLDVKGNFGLASSNDGLYNFIFSNSAASGSNSLQVRSANSILLYNSGNSFYTGLKSNAATNITYTLPTTDGSSGQFLQTNGSGALTWATATGSGGTGSSVGVGQGGQYEMAYYPGTGLSVIGSNTFTNNTVTGVVSIIHSTVSTDTSSGAFKVTGGVGIGGSLYVGGIGASIVGVTFSNSSITRGTWNGTAISPTYGGTGLNNSSATGLLQYSSGTASVITTSSALANIISDKTGTAGKLVFSTSPVFSTGVDTDSGSFSVFNTTATTINAFGAATTLSVGAATGKFTHNSTDNSSSISTGSVVVQGGAGIAKSVSIGGYLQLFNSTNYTAFVSSATGNTVYTLPATSPATGSSVLQSTSAGVMSWVPMVASSGSGLATTATNVNVNTLGNPNSFHPLLLTPAQSSAGSAVSANGTLVYNPQTDILNTPGLAVTSGVNATNTASGAFQVKGGMGITGNAFIGGTINVASTSVSNIANVSFTNGIITSGSWSGSTITAFYGGTGLQGPTAIGDLIVANSATTWSRYATSATSGQVLTSNGTGSAPTWQAVPASAASSVAVAPTTVNASFFVTAVNSSNSSGLGLSTITTFVVNPNSGIVSLSGLAVTNTTASTNTTSGALIVSGGLGLAGNAFIGGTINVASTSASVISGISFVNGAITVGAWNSTVIAPQYGGTGLNNSGQSGILKYTTGTGSLVAAPTGAIVGTTDSQNLTNKTYNSVTITAPASSATLTLANSSSLITSGANSLTLITTATTDVTFPAGTKTLVATDVTSLSSLSTVGVISSGTWSGSTITAFYGGTGLQGPTAIGDLIVANSATTWSRYATSSTSGQVLTSNGTGNAPTWQAVPASAASSVAVAPTVVNAQFFIPVVNAASSAGLGLSSVASLVINPSTGLVSLSGLAVTNTTASINASSGTLIVTGGAAVGQTLSVGGSLNVFNGANYSGFRYSGSANTTYTLPTNSPQSAVGTSVLTSTTAGVMSWIGMSSGGSGSPGGSNKQIQYNNATAFGGASGFEYTTGGIAVTVSVFSPSGIGYTSGLWVSAIGGTTRVGIGLSNPQFELEILGELSATNKSFVIDHPTKSGMKLRYGSLEGPENGVYVRGELKGTNIIEVPDHWIGLVHEDSYTVHLTPIGRFSQLYVEKIENYNVFVAENNNSYIHCYYSVWAERKDIPKLVTEYEAQ